MNNRATTLIDLDWDTFDPSRIQGVRHRLSDHPLLQPDQLVALGKRFQGSTRLFTFNNEAGADANFDDVGRLYPNRKSAADTVQGINDAKAWMLLRHVQDDPTYRSLVDMAMSPIQPLIERKDPGMHYRAGWIFVASPHTTTPFHIDRNHGILLQIRGTKKVYVWDAEDIEVCSEHARDVFHARHDLSLVKWNEAFRERAHVFTVGPGMGVYMPITSPHMVETGDEPSITISFTYSTAATRRNAMRHVVNDLLYRKGIRPTPVGKHQLVDTLTYATASVMVAAHGVGSRPPACPSLAHPSAYAVAD
ncbi:cupin-like domain-containing protein [Dyella sp. 2HG41-7]|uniref:cupin-like domain-containing protein n=1 Tax=Dyella sp. 2HG41-7 TaxID=2883239 RepID=UPI001F31FAFC|nr:cupin-like domain-containing protein [Dyella sp. 2HG41-7]